ncbi:hypothetical protein DBB29_09000 [Pandoraea cepalis]|uniref:Uncharacterized protein n=1 Tax=Pandoraea cepalis TaxID=2508294 RepID=A0AAW7MLP5_9BURK|nr:hypothetical protein [Pandoraea cepalis]MDN4573712.1 hypothetical protein [Pandoraea cepalis]MDN4578254.1 hypothetical protein [Pandoraea cepalis]
MRDPHTTRFIVIPFRKGSGGDLLPAEVRPTGTSVGAVRVARSMRERHAGVAAYEVLFDPETGGTESPKVLFQHSCVPALDDHAAA